MSTRTNSREQTPRTPRHHAVPSGPDSLCLAYPGDPIDGRLIQFDVWWNNLSGNPSTLESGREVLADQAPLLLLSFRLGFLCIRSSMTGQSDAEQTANSCRRWRSRYYPRSTGRSPAQRVCRHPLQRSLVRKDLSARLKRRRIAERLFHRRRTGSIDRQLDHR